MNPFGRALLGRQKIYTDEQEITKENIVDVLKKAYAKHKQNASEIQYLMDYERGDQPLSRIKTIRPEIDIRIADNAANYVKEFKVGYFWSSPVLLVRRGSKGVNMDGEVADSEGITAINEMLRNGIKVTREDQKLAEFVEIGGIGHRMVDIKNPKDYKRDGSDTSFANVFSLDSRYSFCVYHNGLGEKKVLGVTFVKTSSGKLRFTAFTDKYRFDIVKNEVESVQANPLGMIPIVEYERGYDRMGCFERHISDMDGLNTMVSDFANDVSQKTQEIWWGNDVVFPTDENGLAKAPTSGQWILTYSGDSQNPKIQPLSSAFESNSTLNAISYRWNRILQKCKVPTQQDSEGGGSTGVAMDMSTGWSAAEIDACREQQTIESAKWEELELILKAIEFVPTSVLPEDSPIRGVTLNDIDFRFNRKKNYDLAVKANAFATYVSHGIEGRNALKVIDAFEDVEQVWEDSKETIKKYQDSLFNKGNGSTGGSNAVDGKILSDESDQAQNSPFVDGNNAKDNQAKDD